MPEISIGWSSPASAIDRSTVEQRRKTREFCDLLRSDLFQRTGGREDPGSALWTSPLKWAVEYGYNRDGETVWCSIYWPDGRLYGHNDLATIYWLEETLP